MTEDWKGEAFIREVRKIPYGGGAYNVGQNREKSPSVLRQCAFPECLNKLYHHNRYGVCRQHRHAKGYCKCTICHSED